MSDARAAAALYTTREPFIPKQHGRKTVMSRTKQRLSARAAQTEVVRVFSGARIAVDRPAMTPTSDSPLGSSDDPAGPPAPASPTRAVLRLVLLLLAVAAGLWLLFALRGVILLLLLSMLFAYLIAPLVDFLCRPVTWRRHPWALPRPLAVAIVYLALFASLGIASYVLLPLLGAQ
jgi:hypothetical protein